MRPPVAETGELYERAVDAQVQVGRRASVAHQLHLPRVTLCIGEPASRSHKCL